MGKFLQGFVGGFAEGLTDQLIYERNKKDEERRRRDAQKAAIFGAAVPSFNAWYQNANKLNAELEIAMKDQKLSQLGGANIYALLQTYGSMAALNKAFAEGSVETTPYPLGTPLTDELRSSLIGQNPMALNQQAAVDFGVLDEGDVTKFKDPFASGGEAPNTLPSSTPVAPTPSAPIAGAPAGSDVINTPASTPSISSSSNYDQDFTIIGGEVRNGIMFANDGETPLISTTDRTKISIAGEETVEFTPGGILVPKTGVEAIIARSAMLEKGFYQPNPKSPGQTVINNLRASVENNATLNSSDKEQALINIDLWERGQLSSPGVQNLIEKIQAPAIFEDNVAKITTLGLDKGLPSSVIRRAVDTYKTTGLMSKALDSILDGGTGGSASINQIMAGSEIPYVVVDLTKDFSKGTRTDLERYKKKSVDYIIGITPSIKGNWVVDQETGLRTTAWSTEATDVDIAGFNLKVNLMDRKAEEIFRATGGYLVDQQALYALSVEGVFNAITSDFSSSADYFNADPSGRTSLIIPKQLSPEEVAELPSTDIGTLEVLPQDSPNLKAMKMKIAAWSTLADVAFSSGNFQTYGKEYFEAQGLYGEKAKNFELTSKSTAKERRDAGGKQNVKGLTLDEWKWAKSQGYLTMLDESLFTSSGDPNAPVNILSPMELESFAQGRKLERYREQLGFATGTISSPEITPTNEKNKTIELVEEKAVERVVSTVIDAQTKAVENGGSLSKEEVLELIDSFGIEDKTLVARIKRELNARLGKNSKK